MPDVMDLWRTVRAGLIERGVKCPLAETEATRFVAVFRNSGGGAVDWCVTGLADALDKAAVRLKAENPAG